MKVITLADFEANLKAHIDAVHNDHNEQIVINAPDGKQMRLVTTQEAVGKMDETEYLPGFPANAATLYAGMKDLKNGKVICKTLEELIAM